MTPLRQRMLEDMQVRNLSPHTQRAYVESVARFARHFGRSPADLGPDEIRAYQVYLVRERGVGYSSVEIAVCALRFFYKITLDKPWSVDEVIPAPKKPHRLPVVLSPEEVARFLACVTSPKHRAVLSTCYAAGLRISEAVGLRPTDIDSRRMVIRVEQGKGLRDRYVMLSPKLLEILRDWWRFSRPTRWLFPGDRPESPIGRGAVEQACHGARRRAGLTKPVTPHGLRHAFAVHLLEAGTDVRTIQLLLGHRSLETTAHYLRIAATKVCATSSPFDLRLLRRICGRKSMIS
jgi:integrase/recombinase XerD